MRNGLTLAHEVGHATCRIERSTGSEPWMYREEPPLPPRDLRSDDSHSSLRGRILADEASSPPPGPSETVSSAVRTQVLQLVPVLEVRKFGSKRLTRVPLPSPPIPGAATRRPCTLSRLSPIFPQRCSKRDTAFNLETGREPISSKFPSTRDA